MTTYVRAPSCVSSHIHYINSDLRRHFLICGYSIFPSLRRTIFIPGVCLCTTCTFLVIFPLSPRCGDMLYTIFLCLHIVSYPVSLCLHTGFDSFSSCIYVGIDFILVWPKLNHISNKEGKLQSGDDFSAHHVWALKVCEINVPSLRSLPCNQYYPTPPVTTLSHEFLTEAVFALY